MTAAMVFLLLLIIILGVSYFSYCIAFLAPKRVEERQYALPQGEQYVVHHPAIRKCMDEMRAVSFEEVYITAHDGTKLFGRYYHVKDNAPVQIQFHGYKSSAYRDFCGGSKLARSLEHNALVVDQRSHGKSEGSCITFGIKERKDVLSWIAYILDRFGKDTAIILCGLSMGAATVLMAADLALPENVVGIIADCPFSSPKAIIQKVSRDMHLPAKILYPFVKLGAFLFGHFHLEETSAVDAVSKTRLPILLFHGDDDRFVPCEMSREIKAACASSVTLEVIEGAGHGLCYMVEPKRYEEATLHFINSIVP